MILPTALLTLLAARVGFGQVDRKVEGSRRSRTLVHGARAAFLLLAPLPLWLAWRDQPLDAAIAEAISAYLASGLLVTLLGHRFERPLLAAALLGLTTTLILGAA